MALENIERYLYFRGNQRENDRKNKIKRIFLFFFIFSIVVFLIYFFIIEKIIDRGGGVNLKIQTGEVNLIGHKAEVKILINNQEKVDLINSELFINFPQNFSYFSSEPICSEVSLTGCLIYFPRLKKGDQREIKITGQFFGLANEQQAIKASLAFQLENFSAWFKKDVNQNIFLSTTPFDWDFFSPDEAFLSEEKEFRIRIKNPSEETIKARIIAFQPENFNFNHIFLEPTDEREDRKIWEINLEADQEEIIDFIGYFYDEAGDKKFIVELGVLDVNNNFFPQTEKEKTVKIVQPGLVLGLKVNNSFIEDVSKDFSETLEITLAYKNIGQEKIFEPSFKLKIDPSFAIQLTNKENWLWQHERKEISLEKWQVEEKDNGHIIIFSSFDVIEINPGEDGEIKITLKIIDFKETFSMKLTNLSIDLLAEIEAKLFRDQVLIFNSLSNKIKIKINSHVNFRAEAKYYSEEGLKIGDGPLPPEVGQTTSYLVFLRPTNTNNEIKNIKITAKLPERVIFVDQSRVSQGNIFFDNENKKIIWQIDSLPIYSGGPHSFVEASFKVSLTPIQEDQGKILDVLEEIQFEANDSFSGEKILLLVNNLKTDLEFDDRARGLGVIR